MRQQFFADGRIRWGNFKLLAIARDGLDQVSAAYNSDKLTILHNRHALDRVSFERCRDLMQWGIRACGDDLRGHHISHFAGMLLDVIRCERIIVCQGTEPPRSLPLRTGLRAMQEIAFTYDTNDFALVVDDR